MTSISHAVTLSCESHPTDCLSITATEYNYITRSSHSIQELPLSPRILKTYQHLHLPNMPSPQTHIAVAQPSPLSTARRMSPLLTSNTLGRDVCLSLDTKNKPYTFVPRMYENDYAPPAPPPPSPVNFPSESWSTACRR